MFWTLCAFSAAPTAVELIELRRVSNLRLLPTSGDLVYTVSGTTLSEDSWTKTSTTFRRSRTGTRVLMPDRPYPRDLDIHPTQDELLFRRSGHLELLPVDGGEARRIETGEIDPHHAQFSSDGDTILFLGSSPKPADPLRGDAFRFEDGPVTRLYQIPTQGGEPQSIGEPTLHVIDFDEHEGRVAVVTSAAVNDYAESIEPVLQMDGKDVPNGRYCVESPTFSPDGTSLAWIGCSIGGITDALYVYDLASHTTTNVFAHADPTLYGFQWTSKGDLVAHGIHQTQSFLWKTQPRSGRHKELFIGGSISDFVVDSKARTALVTHSTPGQPGRIVSIDLTKGTSTVVVDPNPDASWDRPITEVVAWTSPEGRPLEGLLHRPVDTQKPPLIVLPHGGPDGVSTQRFSSLTTWFATHGYAVFQPNYRGGVGYGRDFYQANRGRLGTIEFMDIEAGVDALLTTGSADPDALFYGGWSWGGYLTAWTIGHTNRYRAAVAGAAVTDTFAQYVGSDINHGRVGDWEYTGRPWLKPDSYEAANPRTFFHQVKTPTLILHGDGDRRVPFDQGVTLYRALSDIGTEVEFFVYPGEGHGLRKPGHQVHRLQTWLDWYEAHRAR